MIKRINNKIEYYQSTKLSQHSIIEHFFSTRKSTFDNIECFASELDYKFKKMIIPQQTHKTNIGIVTNQNLSNIFEDTDALITKEKGISIGIKTADCTPVLLFDPVQKVIAAIHSGWRGTLQNITGKTVQKMISHFYSDSNNIIVAIGPSIGQANYEVGHEVVLLFQKLFSDTETFLDQNGLDNGKAKLNIQQVIKQQLIAEGISKKNIDSSNFCTYNESNYFYSVRREGAQTGRMINGIFLK